MKAALIAAGWLVPGGAFLLLRRYSRFAFWFVLIAGAFGLGIGLQGGNLWPQSAELQGLDNFNAVVAWGGALAKLAAGGPYLLASWWAGAPSLIAGQLHAYGTTLLTVAGLLNLMAVADALETRGTGR